MKSTFTSCFRVLLLFILIFASQQVTAQAPTNPASNINFSSLDGDRFYMSWTRGNGSSRIVIAKQGSPVTAIPSDGTSYSANNTFGDGNELLPGEFVVYNGSGTGFYLEGLSPDTTYHLAIYEYNGSAAGIQFLSTATHASQATVTAPTVQTSGLGISQITGSAARVDWTSGDGNRRILLIKADSPVDYSPIDLQTYNYYYGNTLHSYHQIGSTGNYTAYSGTGSYVNLSGLQPNTTYHIAAFEFNGNLGPVYLVPGSTNSFTTASTPAAQPTNLNFSSIDSQRFYFSFNRSDANAYLVVASENPITGTPVNGTTYTGNTEFGNASASQLNPGEYVISSSNTNSFTMTGLEATTTYYIKIFAYNSAAGETYYLQSNPLSGSQSTLSHPTVQTSGITFSNITGQAARADWTNGNGSRRILLIKEGSAVDFTPVDFETYNSYYSNTFHSYHQIGSTGNYTAYSGSGSYVNMSGLQPNTTYHVAAFEYNGNQGPLYLVPGSTSSFTTSSIPTAQPTNLSFYNIGGAQMRMQFNISDASNYLMVASENPITGTPASGVTYTASGEWGDPAASVLNTGEQVISAGTARTNINLSGLNPSTTYYIAVFAYNITGGEPQYLTTNPLTGSQSTATYPTVQTSNLTVDNVTGSSLRLNWTRGNGNNVLIIGRAGGPVNVTPEDLVTYNAYYSSFGNSYDQIGDTDNYGVYNSSGTSRTITGLTPGVTYHFTAFEHNGTETPLYLTPGISTSQITLAYPENQPTNLSFYSVEGNRFYGSFSGSGAQRYLVVASENPITAIPDEALSYTASSTFGAGDEMSEGVFVIQNNQSTSFLMSGLEPATNYYVQVFAYNFSGDNNYYLTEDPLSGSQSTIGAPSLQASNGLVFNRSANSLGINWTRGNGNRIIVVAREGEAVTDNPVDLTSYSASSNFNSSTWYQLSEGNKIVYNGTGSQVQITNLNEDTTYHFALYEYNGSSYPVYLKPAYRFAASTFGSLPTVQTSNATFTNIGASQATVNFTAGNGPYRLAVAKKDNEMTFEPTNGSEYTANNAFGNSTNLGSNTFAVFNGMNETFVMQNLEPSSTYFIRFFEYNYNEAGQQYLIPGYTASFSTPSIPTMAADNLQITETTETTATLRWQNGNGNARIVVMRDASTGGTMPQPQHGVVYSASAEFGSGDAFGSGYVIYNGSGNTVSISDFTWDTAYDVFIFEYNGNQQNPVYQPTGYQTQITITEDVCPEEYVFDFPTTYCKDETPPELPLISENGIEGTWSPAVIDTSVAGSVEYIFTPDTDCEPFSVMVNITAPVVPVFNIVTEYQTDETAGTLSPVSANGISGTWSPAIIDTMSPGTTEYTFTPDEGQCAAAYSITVVVTDCPAPEFAGMLLEYCRNDVADVLPNVSDNGIEGSWSPASINTTNAGNFTYTFTPSNGCDPVSFEITILTPQTWYEDADGDGFGNASVVQTACSQPEGFVASAGDCDDTDENINAEAQFFSYSGNPGFVNTLVSPLTGAPTDEYQLQVVFTDTRNIMPAFGYPRIIFDYNADGIYNTLNDKTIVLGEGDSSDTTISDGKLYVGTISPLEPNRNYNIFAEVMINGCPTIFGPFDAPDVLMQSDIEIFANDIVFDNPNPDPSSPLQITATIHNKSDLPAENFVVGLINQWDPNINYPDQTVTYIAPNGSADVVWNITTPDEIGWMPMQVSIDKTNVIEESNELDNTAVRPFTNGDYNIPGAIAVDINVSPAVVSPNHPSVYVSGYAYYIDTAVPLEDPSVAGATVTIYVEHLNSSIQVHTDSNGIFRTSFNGATTPGTYDVTAEVTDYTLTGSGTDNYEVVFTEVADWRIRVIYDDNSILEGETTSGTITVTNNGNQNLPETVVDFTQNGGNPMLPSSYSVPALNAGESHMIDLEDMTFSTPGNYSICGTINLDNVFPETYLNNNSSCDYLNVLPALPDLISYSGPQGTGYFCNTNPHPSFSIRNIGHVPSGSFSVEVDVFEGSSLITTETFEMESLNPSQISTVNLAYAYPSEGNYSFTVRVDVPLATNGVVTELNESNNTAGYSRTLTECKPDLTVSGCGSGMKVEPIDPGNASNNNYTATIRNTGNATAFAPFDVSFNVLNGASETVTVNNDLAPGQSVVVTVIMPFAGFNEQLDVVADSGNVINEFNENNNMNGSMLCHEFYLTPPPCGASGDQFWGQDEFIQYSTVVPWIELGNNYLYAASEVNVKFEMETPSSGGFIELGNILENNLLGCEFSCHNLHEVYLNTSVVFSETGTYRFRWTVDSDNAYDECDEDNNVFIRTVEVKNLPDMRVLSQFINPSSLNPEVNEPITFDITYENIAFPNTGQEMDFDIYVDEVLLQRIENVPGLFTHTNNTVPVTVPWSSNEAGAHIVRIVIDSNHEITEVRENNNEATRAVIVGEASNLFFASLLVSDDEPALGQIISIDGVIENNGDIDAAADVAFYYLDINGNEQYLGSLPVSVNAGEQVNVTKDWTVSNPETFIIARIVNTSVIEFDENDNEATVELGAGMTLEFSSTLACATEDTLGSATVNVVNGSGDYTFSWNIGDTTETIQQPAGTYIITVTDNESGEIVTGFVTIFNDEACTDYCPDDPELTSPVVPVFNSIMSAYCQDDNAFDLPATDDNNISGTWLPASIDTSTPGTFTYVFTPDIECSQTFEIEITIHPSSVWYQDADGDGFGNEAVSVTACAQPDGYVAEAGDCDDSDNTIYPGATEIPNDGIDQDCDGSDLVVVIDGDNDGVADDLDNCPNTYNPDQADGNGDGIGDACEECDLPYMVVLNRTSPTTATFNAGNSVWHYQGSANRAGRPLRPYPMYGMNDMTVPHTQYALVPAFEYDVWLRTICDDGSFSPWAGPYFLPTFETGARRTPRMDITPNPAIAIVKISKVEAKTIEVFDMNGGHVKTFNTNDNQFDMTGLPTGKYNLRVIDAEGNIHYDQVIKK